jgi:hypothetical protein
MTPAMDLHPQDSLKVIPTGKMKFIHCFLVSPHMGNIANWETMFPQLNDVA